MAVGGLLIIIFLIAVFVLYRRNKIKVIKNLGNAVNQALIEYDTMFDYFRIVEKTETDSYCFKHKELISKIDCTTSSIWISKKLTAKHNFALFLQKYNQIETMRAKNNKIYHAIQTINNNIYDATNNLDVFNSFIEYHSYHNIEHYKASCADIISAIEYLLFEDKLNYVTNEEKALRYKSAYSESITPTTIKQYNAEFVRRKKQDDKDFFDSCLKYPLDEQQREAILRMEDNTLVISSAGSGKTSTMVGKARYMVEKVGISPDNILIITYTRKAAEELSSRLNIDGLTCSTFHALAVKIIADITEHKRTICAPDLLLNSFYELVHNNVDYLQAVNRYMLEMKSLMKLEHEYNTAYDYYNDRKKYGIQAIFPDMNNNTIFTKSEEEKRICEWLSIHNVSFLYEYPYPFSTSDREHRQYKPDFTIIYKDAEGKEHHLYLEHYAINSKGEVPYWFGTDINSPLQDEASVTQRWVEQNKKYKEGIMWKNHVHMQNGTKLIYTTSAMFHDGTIWQQLEQMLKDNNVKCNNLSPEEINRMLVSRNKGIEKSLFKLIEQFIALQKCNCIKFEELINKSKENNDKRSEFIISQIIEPVARQYQQNLDKRGEIDFTDAIIRATELCNDGKWKLYDYILIDEFQDISVDRYKFLLSLRKDASGIFTKLFCVGDDWQSIYRFSGSDMSLFYDFEDYFGVTEHCKIETTYRFHEPVISLSSEFIQKNPYQVKKNIKGTIDSEMKLGTTITECDYIDQDFPILNEQVRLNHVTKQTNIDFHSYSSEYDERVQVENIIKNLPSNESILILGRYNYDAGSLGYQFKPNDADKKTIYITLSGRRIKFMSVHGAKGLEADHVILLNCNQGINGFPSLIEDDPILNFVLSDKDTFENAEERRVFYVAITRAKKNTHIFYDAKKPSSFVEEFIDFMNDEEEMPCPTCGHGHIKIIKEGTNKYGAWIALGCSNYGAGCPFFEFSTPEEYQLRKRDFDSRNAKEPVQEKGINATKKIKGYLEVLQNRRDVHKSSPHGKNRPLSHF